MKLKTSFFNPTVLKKDITRFAPVWGLYSIFMLLFVLLMWESNGSSAWIALDAPEIMLSMGIVNFCYAGLCALLLFGDLFKTRMCNALHAMPLRREGWFLTHVAAGLLFCVVPNLVGALIAGMMLQQYCYTALLWLAVMVLQYLFFFGIGVFACLCAGNYLGATAVYGIVNFLAVLVTWLAITFIEPVLYGVNLDAQQCFSYSPVVAFTTFNYIDMEFYSAQQITKLETVYWEQWRYLGIAAGVGVVFMGLSVLLYRKRKLESAGDLIAVQPVQPIFLVCYSLCVGALFYLVADITNGDLQYLFLLIGLAVGYFTGKMLLEKKVRVFTGKNFLRFGILVLALMACIVTARLDPVGITRYVPEAEQVKSIEISPYGSTYYRNETGYTITQPEDIATLVEMHQELVDAGCDTGTMTLNLKYTMKNGTVVKRQYMLEPGSEQGQLLKHYYSSLRWIFGVENPEELLFRTTLLEVQSYNESIPSVIVHGTQYDAVNWFEEKWGDDGEVLTYHATGTFDKDPVAAGLLDAIRKDCAEGRMAQLWDYHQEDGTEAYVVLQYFDEAYDYQMSRDITIYSNCKHTIAYLLSLQAE